jgi:hypothetical protein
VRGEYSQQTEKAHSQEQGTEISPEGVDANGAGGLSEELRCRKNFRQYQKT